MKILSNSIVNQQAKSTINPNFKSLKFSPQINKEIARSATNVLTVASAIATSAIAGIALTKKQKEEEEKQLIQQLKNPNEFIVALGEELGAHKHITKEDIYSLAQHFEYAPGFISDLILLKDDKGNPRSVKKNEVANIMQAYKENPQLVESLVEEKNEKGEFKYNGEEINILTILHNERPDLYEVAKINPTRVLNLSQKTNTHGKKIYSANNIKAILVIEKNGTEYGKALLKMKDYESKDPRFTPKQLKLLMKKHEQYPDFIEALVNAKYADKSYKYNAKEIAECVELLNDKNIEAAKKLLNKKITCIYGKDKIKQENAYELYQINKLLEAHSKSLYDFCHYVIKNETFFPERVKFLLDTFNVESIPQDFITRIKNDIEENWKNFRYKESLSVMESRVQ